MEESRSPTHLNGVTSCYCSHIIIRYGYVGEIMKNDRFVSTNSREDCWGNPTGDVLIIAHRRVKHTDTIFNVVRQIAYIHGRGSFY
jgi:hypothetical protein